LFRASAETLLEVARDPRHLGADIGFLSVLHTWGQNLLAHPHLHCVIPAGGIPILPARPRTQSRLPRQVRRRPKTPIPATPTHLRRNSSNTSQ
jgi:hypothetical protein